MRKFLLFSISLLLGISLFVWIYKQFDLEEIFLRFRFLNWQQVLVLFLLTFYRFYAWVLRWDLVLRGMGFKNLPFKTLFAARVGEMSLSYITPGIYYGGEIVRVLVLKKKAKISLPFSLASVICDRIIDITSFGVFAFFGFFVLFLGKYFLASFFFLILSLLPLLLIFLIFRLLKSNKIEKLIRFFNINKISNSNNICQKAEITRKEIISFFKNSPKEIFQGMLFSCSAFIATSIQIMLFVHFLGEYCTFFKGVLVRILNLFSTLVPIPAGLGLFEGSNILGFKLLGLSVETGLGLTLLMRLFDISFVLIGFSIILYYLSYHIIKIFNKKVNNNHN